ncbi:hypothetical protein LTR99_004219 [Exophiala xenobiotica]|nr:hypothetical protein LTR99_004219 [Exophiala xenobiotica]KAK5435688.1 hypothetical protein LTR34_003192 [Exophiala xenobiotica]
MPDFHHAAAHKLFHCWPKLRISLANLDIEPVTFFKNVDDADTFSFQNAFDTTDLGEIHVSEAASSISAIFEDVSQLPFILRHLLTTGGLTKEACLGLFNRYSDFSTGYDVLLQFENQSAEELLIQTVAFKHMASTSTNVSVDRQADLCFKFALGRMWMIQSQQNPQTLPFKFLFVICLLSIYGRPFHALGLLQSMEPQIHNASPMMRGDFDILTEVDGVPGKLLRNNDLRLHEDALIGTPSDFSVDSMTFCGADSSTQELQAHLRLRGYLNTIIDSLYPLERAYCRPYDVAVLLTDIARRLDLWYWTLPINMRFPRHASALLLTKEPMNPTMDELRFRYHAALFLINRPVLYYVLHERLEHAATASELETSKNDPWVYESCYNCLQNAIMIVLLHTQRPRMSTTDGIQNWCNLQHLIAAFAILVQVQSSPDMSILIRNGVDINTLLDEAEEVLEQGMNRPANIRETLHILRNIRQKLLRNNQRTP